MWDDSFEIASKLAVDADVSKHHMVVDLKESGDISEVLVLNLRSLWGDHIVKTRSSSSPDRLKLITLTNHLESIWPWSALHLSAVLRHHRMETILETTDVLRRTLIGVLRESTSTATKFKVMHYQLGNLAAWVYHRAMMIFPHQPNRITNKFLYTIPEDFLRRVYTWHVRDDDLAKSCGVSFPTPLQIVTNIVNIFLGQDHTNDSIWSKQILPWCLSTTKSRRRIDSCRIDRFQISRTALLLSLQSFLNITILILPIYLPEYLRQVSNLACPFSTSQIMNPPGLVGETNMPSQLHQEMLIGVMKTYLTSFGLINIDEDDREDIRAQQQCSHELLLCVHDSSVIGPMKKKDANYCSITRFGSAFNAWTWPALKEYAGKQYVVGFADSLLDKLEFGHPLDELGQLPHLLDLLNIVTIAYKERMTSLLELFFVSDLSHSEIEPRVTSTIQDWVLISLRIEYDVFRHASSINHVRRTIPLIQGYLQSYDLRLRELEKSVSLLYCQISLSLSLARGEIQNIQGSHRLVELAK